MVKCLYGRRFRVSDKILFSMHQPAKCGFDACLGDNLGCCCFRAQMRSVKWLLVGVAIGSLPLVGVGEVLAQKWCADEAKVRERLGNH